VKAFTAGITPLPTTAHHFRSWEVDVLGKRMRRVMAHVTCTRARTSTEWRGVVLHPQWALHIIK
jgi:hypothetical protein